MIIRFVATCLLAAVCISCRASDPRSEHSAAIPSLLLADAPLATIGGLDERAGYAIGSLAAAVLIRDRIVIADGSASSISRIW